ncbi:MAG TPA: hypothetical protein VNK49_12720 [Anaerolineales bacterium]|nr:hypothetical protein [Anaerolineales bacterium]
MKMKKIIPTLLCFFLLAACNGWSVQPIPFPTPFPIISPTPSIYTATPVVIGPTHISPTPFITTATTTVTPLPTNTNLASPTFTPTPVDTITPTSPANTPALLIQILGCNTSIDITHGMGEVTNAFVTLKNTGNVELTNLTATLYALDEGREHPDKTVKVPSLPVGYQVNLKLTVDSTYRQETPIQVEVKSEQGIFPREGAASCRDIGIFAPSPNTLNTPLPSNP